jgi:glycosyltransferase involved in cell wall biosynthesis
VTPRIVLGLQGAQIHGNVVRGIARYIREHARAVAQAFPENVVRLDVTPGLPLPVGLEMLPPQIPVSRADTPLKDAPGVIYHVMSPMEGRPLDDLWPVWAQEPPVHVVVTLYDLIPLIFRSDYFHGPLQRLLTARYELIRSAHGVLAISQQTANDAVELLGIDSSRVFTILSGSSSYFHPAQNPEASMRLLKEEFPALQPEFFFFASNSDPRKNTGGLLRAYALLAPSVRARHHLVVTCSQANTEFLAGIQQSAFDLGIAGTVHVRSFVADPILLALYQSCLLFVFPSFYEGFGLPALEAMRCGAAVVVADNSSLREIVRRDDARFDPASAEAIAGMLLQAVEDPPWVQSLRGDAIGQVEHFTWAEVAKRTMGAYRAVTERSQ